jgi:hypothetical protein
MPATKWLEDVPGPDAPLADQQEFVRRGYGLPDDYTVPRVVRHGGRGGTALDVFIRPPGGGRELRIRYPREDDCSNPTRLRSRATAETRGLTRGHLITSQKAALAMFEVLCSLADTFEAMDESAEVWEWLQLLVRAAGRTRGECPDANGPGYHGLKRLQEHDYSKRLVTDPPLDGKGNAIRPFPMLFEDDQTGELYVPARHLAVFLKYEVGVEKVDPDRVQSWLAEVGGRRCEVERWDRTDRQREHHVKLVLYLLPGDGPEAGGGDDA